MMSSDEKCIQDNCSENSDLRMKNQFFKGISIEELKKNKQTLLEYDMKYDTEVDEKDPLDTITLFKIIAK